MLGELDSSVMPPLYCSALEQRHVEDAVLYIGTLFVHRQTANEGWMVAGNARQAGLASAHGSPLPSAAMFAAD
jgi:hypothetical protein